ncbi:hypothetical protein dsat_0161 [Alkalidesulfovibrio alkalitolerans DSM 16529]|jgi:hypothetical protein|uniref:Uncharacterized protein n=1 Tax=Alkalidesulfovibrio alkalitolerans DSM 16529 TaxID=1121439 RepID=S7TBJ2_9BACT|nr:hypothetical protein [Alkalidesulfovibrio alkalitolerans]EPR33996.1 hypothetical protein dsat_0161 [Alkalidesulfovibrio alkalitolerans DSM 16529]
MISEEPADLQATIEQTDSGEQQYVLRVLCDHLSGIREELSGIRTLLEAGHAASEAMRGQAQAYLEAQQAKTQEYLEQVQIEPESDFYPFVELPAGTEPRDLPDGNRLFTLPDGMILRTTDDHRICVIDAGEQQVITPGPGTAVEVAPGRLYTLVESYLRATQEAAGISGLPAGIEPTAMGAERFAVVLPEGIRLDVDHRERFITLINPAGPIDIIGIGRIEGIGETIAVRLLSGGARGFQCGQSGHGGLIETDGTIHLGLKSGLDLVVRFQGEAVDDGAPENGCSGQCGIHCEERT